MAEKKYLDSGGLTTLTGMIKTKVEEVANKKQDKLVSGTNIKTVGGNSLLGSGNISVGVTGVGTGAGLTGGTITSTGTIKCNLASETSLGTIGTTPNLYAVGVDSNNKLGVKVPAVTTEAAGLMSAIDKVVLNTLQNTIDTKASQSDLTAATNRITTAEGKITALETAVDTKATQSDLDDTEERITAAEGKINTAESNISTLETELSKKATSSALTATTNRITTAEGKITALETAVDTKATQSDLDDAEERITAAEGKINTAESNISTLETELGKKATSSALTAATNRITTAEGDISTLETELSKKATTSALTAATNRITTVEGKMTTAESNISTLETELGKKATTSALTAATNRITAAEGKITALETAVDTKAAQSDLTAATNRITTAEGKISTAESNISALETAVDTKAAQSDLDDAEERITTAEGKITTAESNISALETELGKKATTSALTAATNRITTVEGKITTAESNISALETELDKKATTSALTAATNRITTAEGKITALETVVDTKAAQSDLDDVEERITTAEGKITTAESDISALETELGKKATISALTAATNRITTAEGKITTAESNISTLETELDKKATTSALTAATNRITTAEGKITTLETVLGTKAPQSDLDDAEERITAAESNISALETELDKKATTSALNTLTNTVNTKASQTALADAVSRIDAVETELDEKAPLASPTFTGTPKSPTPSASTNNTQIATTAFVQTVVDNKIAAADAMIYKGTIGTNGTVTSLPNTTAKTGWTYKVITAGTYSSNTCEIGDLIICLTDGSSTTNATWTVVQTNIDGAVVGPTLAVNGGIAVFDDPSGKVIKDSGFTIGKSVPSNAVFTDTNTKVTSVDNHYTPAENTDAAISASGGTATNITGTSGKLNVVTGLKRDAKGHIVGVTSANIYSTDNNTNYYPTAFAWTNGAAAGPTGSLTGTGMSAITFPAIPSATASTSGVVTTGTQTFAGSKIFKDNITILAENNDKFINFKYSTTDLDSYSWRIGYLGTGQGDNNAFTIQTNKTGSWVDALKFTLPGDATFSKTVTATKFITSGGTSSQFVRGTGSCAALTKSEVTTALGLTPTANTGTVTSIATGAGLTGGSITTSGTIKCNLNSETSLGTIGSTSKLYAVGVDANNKLCVNVPWSDSNTHYTTGINVGGSGVTSNAAATNPYITIKDNSTHRGQIQLKGSGATTISSDTNGVVTISSTNTDTSTTYDGHYTPAENTDAAISASGGSATNITGTSGKLNVVTGLKRDAKGHITGVTSANIYSTDNNSTYANYSFGNGYATCATAEATTAKVATYANYLLKTGGIVAVKFTYAVPAESTLNINSKGAKPIYYNGTEITAGVISAGEVATFVYDGTNYVLLSTQVVTKARLGAHKHAYTPAGTIGSTTATGTVGNATAKGSVSSTFTGTAHNHEFTGTAHKHTFTGTAHKHTFTGTAATSGGPSGTTSVYSITGVGSLPSCTLPSTTVEYSNGELSITHNAGSFNTGSLPSRSQVTVASSNHTHSVTATGTIGNTTAGGSLNEVTATGTIGNTTAGGSVSSTFTGTAHNHSFAGTAHNHSFTGTAGNATTIS